MNETGFERTTRLTLEKTIKEHFIAGDIRMVDEVLDKYPKGHLRKEISLEQAHHIARVAVGWSKVA